MKKETPLNQNWNLSPCEFYSSEKKQSEPIVIDQKDR